MEKGRLLFRLRSIGPEFATVLPLKKVAGQGKRMRRIAIVALARKLLVALWRYVQDGVVPQGAALKADRVWHWPG